jgi:hypothetical protein
MAVELKLIAIYLAVSDACRDIVGTGRLRVCEFLRYWA